MLCFTFNNTPLKYIIIYVGETEFEWTKSRLVINIRVGNVSGFTLVTLCDIGD
jgi:hypothetical protein